MNALQNQDGSDWQQINAQVGVQNAGRVTSGHGNRESEDATMQDSTASRSLPGSVQAKVNGVPNCGDAREGSAQASADFLLLMADPGHVTPNSSQQPGNGANLPNGYLNSVTVSTHGTAINVTPAFVPTDRLSSPEKNLNPRPFIDNPNPVSIGSPGKNDTHQYRETPHARNMLAGPVTSANA